MANNNPHRIILLGNKKSGKTQLTELITPLNPDSASSGTVNLEIHHIDNSIFSQASTQGKYVELVDTPGLNTFFSQNKEGHLTRKAIFLQEYDSIIFVIDPLRFKRSLALFLQASLLNKPLSVVFNDRNNDYSESIQTFSQLFGIKTVSFSSLKNNKHLFSNLFFEATLPKHPENSFFNKAKLYAKIVESSPFQLKQQDKSKVLMGLGQIPEILNDIKSNNQELFFWMTQTIAEKSQNSYFGRTDLSLTDSSFSGASEIQDLILHKKKAKKLFFQKAGELLTKPLTGLPFAFLILYLMYLFVGKFGATFLVDYLDKNLFAAHLMPAVNYLVSFIPIAFIREAFMDPNFGIFPTAIFLAFGLVLPVILTYFFFIGILEEMNYFPRLSVLLNNSMKPMGLNGKGVMPILMGFSCITMALITTRVLDTKKEKIIASLILLLGIPCAPLLSTMFLILGKMNWTATLFVFGFIFIQIALAGFFTNKVLPGQLPAFITEIPPLKLPSVFSVAKKSLLKAIFFLKEALPYFILGSFFLFLAQKAGFLLWLEQATAPLVTKFWGLPKEAVQVLIKTLIRRENGIAELVRIKHLFSNTQAVSMLILMTILIPCVNSLLILFKERGLKISFSILAIILVYSTLTAGGLNLLFSHVSFNF
ncbi:MAG: 50S ribosome-binding GTPase [Deltaproteobacteria bacterium]|jgi:ferrous iron transport protein B|nr:50S ribosome-binding GTPase [Deltaproteobacteria bacterium]